MRRLIYSLLLFVCVSPVAAAEWPQFRGPDGQGHSTAKNVPAEWSETKRRDRADAETVFAGDGPAWMGDS